MRIVRELKGTVDAILRRAHLAVTAYDNKAYTKIFQINVVFTTRFKSADDLERMSIVDSY